MKKIIWLVSWFPNESDPYSGDFIARHAEAVTPFASIECWWVAKQGHVAAPASNPVAEPLSPLTEERVIRIGYSVPAGPGPIRRLASLISYVRMHDRQMRRYMSSGGKPDGIHVHVALKAGLAAWYLKKKYKISYVVSEHWSGLCPEAAPGFSNLSFIKRQLWKKVMRESSGSTAVSLDLARNMKRLFPETSPRVIPNVVNPRVFYPEPVTGEDPMTRFHFLHVSGLSYQKNIGEIIAAASLLKSKWPEFRLTMIGSDGKAWQEQVAAAMLTDTILFLPPVSQKKIAEHLNRSAGLILYSLYETFGCVVIEANACGKPVFVSDLPVFREIVSEGKNGFLIQLHRPEQLAAAVDQFISTNQSSSRAQIVESTRQYHYPVIGKKFASFYGEVF